MPGVYVPSFHDMYLVAFLVKCGWKLDENSNLWSCGDRRNLSLEDAFWEATGDLDVSNQ